MLTKFQLNERKNRDKSYQQNLVKEQINLDLFIKLIIPKLKCNYQINPTDSSDNLLGSDIKLISDKGSINVDLKGFVDDYQNVVLSTNRSYDNKTWYSTIDNRNTDLYVFVDPNKEIFLALPKKKLISLLPTLRTKFIEPTTAGHYQRICFIPKSELVKL